MKFIVYIIFSNSLGKYYVGSTDNFERRIGQHNTGRSNFTSKGIPWIKIKMFDCTSRTEAVNLERRIKKRGIKRFLEEFGT